MQYEEWKQIEEYPRYFVSNMGRIKSTIGKEKILLPNIIGQYEYVKLYKEPTEESGNFKLIRIHRIVAQYFCEGFNKECEVHHKNSNSRDNRSSNLVCLTREQHMEVHRNLKEKAAARGTKDAKK